MFPASNASAGLALPTSIAGKYVLSVDGGATPGVINVTYNATNANAAIQGKMLVFSSLTHGGSIEWHCTPGATPVADKYLPTSCR